MTMAVWALATAPQATVKLAVFDPGGTVTDDGTGNAFELVANDTSVPLGPAGAARVTVQTALFPAPTIPGLQTSELSGPELCAVRLIWAVWEPPLRVAVMVALWLDATEPADAEKLAVFDPAATLTVAGTVRLVLLLESETLMVVEPAALDKVTVQVDDPPVVRLVGVQDSRLTAACDAREMDADCEPPFNDAVTDAVWSLVMAPAVAVNVAVLDPAATDTVAGTVNRALLLLSETVAAALTAFDRVTVQLEVAADPRVVGVQDSKLTTACDAREIDADCEPPFNDAVTDAVWSVVMLPAVAVNVAVLDPPATDTVAGTVNSALLLLSATVEAAPTAFDRVTVQVEVAADPRLVGEQDSRLTTACETKEMDADCELPFNDAVTEAVWSLVMVPAVAVNVAVLDPDATGSVAATVSNGLLLLRATVAPAAPAAFDRVTVQVVFTPDPRVAGVHVSKLTTAGATSEMDVACEPPFRDAVTTAVWSAGMVPAVAVNVAVVAPEGIVTAAGTVSSALLLVRDAAVRLPLAGFDNVTVQVAVAAEFSELGVHDSMLTTVAVPSRMDSVCELPFNEAVREAV